MNLTLSRYLQIYLGLSVILFDTSNEQDVNINEVIAKAVMEETETRMMAQGDFQPATVSTEISPVKSSSKATCGIVSGFLHQ
jgi:hypothetical protein